MVRKLFEHFMEKNCKPRGIWNRKSNKEKSAKVMIKIEKAMIVHSIGGLIRKISLYRMSYFPGSYIW